MTSMNKAKSVKNESINKRIDLYIEQKPTHQTASAEQDACVHVYDQTDNRETIKTDQMTSWIMHTLQRIEEEIAQLKKGDVNKHGAKAYRKNDRVVYIPKNEKTERVLAAFKEDPREPLKVTILRMIDFAEKHLGKGTVT